MPQKIWKFGWQIRILCPKLILNREFSIVKLLAREVMFYSKNLKLIVFYQRYPK